MSNDKKKKPKKKATFGKILKIIILTTLILTIVAGGVVAGAVISIVRGAPEIEPTNIIASLAQTSRILDQNGNLIEKIQAPEFRTVVTIDQIPQHTIDAFISIEDERFYDHKGVDPVGILAAVVDNIKSGSLRGASTITQQLARNLYLTNEVSMTRKITEAYLAIQIEQALTKNQTLEAYLNRSFFGQNAYGVQEAARTYFSKDVQDLTIAESAIIAGIVKGPNIYQPYTRISPENFDPAEHYEVGRIDVLGEKYVLAFNERSVERQKLVLKKMLELEKITQAQYDQAIAQDIRTSLQPEQKKNSDITSYFTDYIKSSVVESLVEKLGYTREQAEDMIFAGGLDIYATIDLNMQQQLEHVYENFTEVLVGNTSNIRGPVLVDWNLNSAGNVTDDKGKLLFYKKENILTEDYNLRIEAGSYQIDGNGDLIINSNKLNPYPTHIDIEDYYTIDDRKNLVTHTVGSIVVTEEDYSILDDRSIRIGKGFLDKNTDFYKIENDNLFISSNYFYISKEGIVQPQSATVVLDYRTGHIKALVGGRDVEGQRILNRATGSARQPGSVIKPIAVYYPALDNGYTAASPIDDVPFYDSNGNLWPRNLYRGYRGINTLRMSLEQSINVNSVKTLEDIGIETSMSYLEKMGIIDSQNPSKDNLVTRAENPSVNDENLSALALGGMTKGLSPLEITSAYGTIANGGVYVEPIAFTKIIDKNGNVLLDNSPKENMVTSPQIAYIMNDILRTSVTNGLAGRAKISNMAVAGKTGTTNEQADIWFIGYTPYYVSGVWIGNDSPKITISKGSGTAAQLWSHINSKVHENLESKTSFDKPEGIVTANICTQSGKLATSLCSSDPRGVVKSEIFAAGTEPTEYCDMHVQVRVDTSTGKVANEYCPDSSVSTRVYVRRDPPYSPSANNGLTPSDYQYQAPTAVCDVHNKNTAVPANPLEGWFDEWFNENGEDRPNDTNDEGNNNGNSNDEEIVPLDPIFNNTEAQ